MMRDRSGSGGETVRIVGVDCATDPRRVGLASGLWSGGPVAVTDTYRGPHPAGAIARWVAPGERVLLALDAPLGWPAPLGPALAGHRAGDAVVPDADRLFSRDTDRNIHRRFGKKPLEVGANFIARTAVAALAMLDQIRHAYQVALPLAWDPAFPDAIAGIEVYPAATLLALGIEPRGYKKNADREGRRRIIGTLGGTLDLGAVTEACLASPDVLDAAICVLAGADFLDGRAVAPDDVVRAQREGWIWVRDSGDMS